MHKQTGNLTFTVFNKKGGVGKTSLAFNVAKDLDYPLLSNDDSVIEEIYPNKAKILDKLQMIDSNVCFDLGGYIDAGIIDIFKQSDLIIVPTLLDVNSIKRTINTVVELAPYCQSVIIVINKVQSAKLGKYKQSISALQGLGKEIFYIRESEAIPNGIHLGKTITELYGKSKFTQHQYKGIFEDYNKLLKRLKNGRV